MALPRVSRGAGCLKTSTSTLRAGDRVAIIGPNGVGKSTLLNIIARKLKADAGEVEFGANVDLGYYEQHQTGLDRKRTS